MNKLRALKKSEMLVQKGIRGFVLSCLCLLFALLLSSTYALPKGAMQAKSFMQYSFWTSTGQIVLDKQFQNYDAQFALTLDPIDLDNVDEDLLDEDLQDQSHSSAEQTTHTDIPSQELEKIIAAPALVSQKHIAVPFFILYHSWKSYLG